MRVFLLEQELERASMMTPFSILRCDNGVTSPVISFGDGDIRACTSSLNEFIPISEVNNELETQGGIEISMNELYERPKKRLRMKPDANIGIFPSQNEKVRNYLEENDTYTSFKVSDEKQNEHISNSPSSGNDIDENRNWNNEHDCLSSIQDENQENQIGIVVCIQISQIRRNIKFAYFLES